MRLRLLLPLILLALAALACDGGISYNTIYVAAVDADAAQPGHVRVIVRQMVGFVPSESEYYTPDYGPTSAPPLRESDYYYASTDDGRTWTPTDAFDAPDPSIYLGEGGYSRVNEAGYSRLFGGETWVFPRAGFRDFFYRSTDDGTGDSVDYFVVGQGGYHNRIAGDTIYISMGTEGILVGPAPGVETTRSWELRQNIPGLRALPLGFSDPLTVAGVVLAALLLPPLPFLHAYLLSRVWRYLLPASDAWRKALRLSLAFAALAAIAIILWIVPTTFDIGFYPMAVAVGLIVVVVSVLMTVRHARAAGLARGAVRRAGIVAAVVSSLVPLGVLAVWWAWWLVLLLIFGYMAMWGVANRHLRRSEIISDPLKPIMHWHTDRLALEGMLVCLLISLPLGAFAYFARPILFYRLGMGGAQTLIDLGIFAGVLVLSILLVRWRMGRRGRELVAAAHSTAYRAPSWGESGLLIAGWLAATGVVSIGVWVGQLYIAGWFQSLMTP